MVLVKVEVVQAQPFFLILNLIYVCSKVRYEGRVDDSLPLVIEKKYLWWGAYINPSIFHILLVHYTTLFATELLPIFVWIEYTFGSKFRINTCKLVWTFVALLTPSSYITSTSSLASKLASAAIASSLASSNNFGCVGFT